MAAVSVTTSATLVAEATAGAAVPADVIITNNSGNTVYLGTSSAVTTSTGIALATASSLGIKLIAGRKIYGIAGGTSELRVEVWE